MRLMTKALARKTPALYSQDEKEAPDIKVPVKIFDPTSQWTWYMTEYDPAHRLCFGFVVGDYEELGYFDLNELEQVRGRFGLPLERDRHWDPNTTLAQVMSGERR